MTPYNDPVLALERLLVGVMVAVAAGVVTRVFHFTLDEQQLETARAGVTIVVTSVWPNLMSKVLWERRKSVELERLAAMRAAVVLHESPVAAVRRVQQAAVEAIDMEMVRIKLLLPFMPVASVIDGNEVVRRALLPSP